MQKKPPFINIVIATLLALSTALIGLLSGFAPNEPLPAVTPYLRFTWPLLGIVTLVFIGLTVWQTVRQSSSEHDDTVSWSEHRKQSIEQQNRQRMLAKVDAFWIKGVLEKSLHGAALIALGLHEQQDAIANPWRLIFQQPDQPESPLPPGTSITEVYNDVGGELLILGEPGSGKTTLLLEITRHLLDHAEQDDKLQMPVVFNLSSWATKQQPLAQWLVEELMTKYQVSRKLGQAWVNNDQILPLLDGLDEVTSNARAACVDAINTYRQEHMVPTVVCSRRTEYLTQTKRVALRNAVVVQPLTVEQIDAYLSSAGSQLAAVRVALNEDKVLQELATTPLMLNILILAYRGVPLDEIIEGGSREARQEQLLASYVQRMLKRRRAETRYTPEQTTHWLSRLAGQMKRQGQTIFYLEQMQPTWLAGQRMLRVYDWLAVRLPGMLMGILVSLAISVYFLDYSNLPFLIPTILLGGLLGGLLSEGSIPQQPIMSGGKARSALGPRLLKWLLIGALIGLGVGLGYGLSAGLSVGLSAGLCSILIQFLLWKNNTTEAHSPMPSPVKGTLWQRLIRRREVHNGLLVGLSTGLIYRLIYWLSAGLSVGLSAGLSVGLSTGVLIVLLIGRSIAVQPTDLLVWSWRSLGKSLFSKPHISMTVQVTVLIWLISGLGIGLISGLGHGLVYGLVYGLVIGLVYGLNTGLSFWLLLGLFQGVSGATIEEQRRVVPNQGIRRSALNGLVFGLISMVIVGLIVWLDYGLGLGLSYRLLSYGLPGALLAGLSAGLVVGLHYGGLASFRHYVARYLLWRTGTVPWHYVSFLDYAAERILLRKVGGGYIFIHRLLLEYFASLDTATKSSDMAKQP